jgi:hypothetical protein
MRVEVSFDLRKSRGNSKSKLVYYHISVNGFRTKNHFSTGVSIMPDEWDGEKQLPKNSDCEDYVKLYGLKEEIKNIAKNYDRI